MEPIRNRRPTKEDCPEPFSDVLVYRHDRWFPCHYENVKDGEWWKPIDQTPPPEDPVSKRRTHRRVCGGETIHYIEVCPDDPKDLDAFIKDAMRLANDFATNYDHCEDAHKHANGACRVCNAEAFLARHGEGGEE